MTHQQPKLIVAVYLRGTLLKPGYVSAITGINPTRSHTKGDRKITSSGHEVIEKIGIWSLAAASESPNISDHLTEIVKMTGGKPHPFHGIKGVEEAYIDVYMAEVSDLDGEGTSEFELSREDVEKTNGIGLPIRFTVDFVREI